jgi:hypothetical protein
MAVEKSYARLGFFIVVTALVILATAVVFIQRLKSRPAMSMVTYTTENVFGLDVSSPVRLRGVPVGRITDIRVDPRGSVVEIDFELFLDRLSNIGVDIDLLQKRVIDIGGVAPHLRSQIMGNPMTGEAYLLLDQPANPPPPMELGFKPTRTYVPSMPSTLTRVQDRLPQLLDLADETLRTLTQIVDKVPDSFDRGDRFFTNADRIIRESQLPALSADSRKFFATTSAQMEQMKSDMAGAVRTEEALVKFTEEARAAIKDANLPATTQAARDAADNSRLASDDLRRTLPAIRNSLEQMNELARQLQEQPESVVYGPRQGQVKNK